LIMDSSRVNDRAAKVYPGARAVNVLLAGACRHSCSPVD
jgi:hypothetical protein